MSEKEEALKQRTGKEKKKNKRGEILLTRQMFSFISFHFSLLVPVAKTLSNSKNLGNNI